MPLALNQAAVTMLDSDHKILLFPLLCGSLKGPSE